MKHLKLFEEFDPTKLGSVITKSLPDKLDNPEGVSDIAFKANQHLKDHLDEIDFIFQEVSDEHPILKSRGGEGHSRHLWVYPGGWKALHYDTEFFPRKEKDKYLNRFRKCLDELSGRLEHIGYKCEITGFSMWKGWYQIRFWVEPLENVEILKKSR